jgi:hypothetical protein
MKFESLKVERSRDYTSGQGWSETIKGKLVTTSPNGSIELNLSEAQTKKIMAVVASSLVEAAENAAAGLLQECEALGSVPLFPVAEDSKS